MCPTSSDGAVETTASGGMLDYSYSWVLNGTEESTEEDPSRIRRWRLSAHRNRR